MEIPEEVYEEMVRHAVAALPEEACGLLAAGPDGRATRAYCLANVDRSPVSYTLDPGDHVAALYDAEARGWHLAGVFHSHPRGPAVPSDTDVARALEPDWLYVVVAWDGAGLPEMRGFRIVGGEAAEEPIVVAGAV